MKAVWENCRKTDWVIDPDIKGFFDNIDHSKLMLAIKRHVSEKWCLMYNERWLQMPSQKKTGELVAKEGKGTTQGGVISPLLANLFLHYAMDKWLEQTHPAVRYVRYADDAILHFNSIVGVAQILEPYIRGWVNYYGKLRLWELNLIFQLLRRRLVMWARNRYKRYRTSVNRTYKWLGRVKEQFPNLFYQWRLGFS